MRIVVIGSGIAGLTAARDLAGAGHDVTVLDKGRRPGGRLATRDLAGGAVADHGAQFFTARSVAFRDEVERRLADGTVVEWCRGFTGDDGHPRYTVPGGMWRLAAVMSAGLDVRQSTRVDRLTRDGDRWVVRWAAGHGQPAGSLAADAVVLTAPVPQSAALLGDAVDVPPLTYLPTLCLLVGLDRAPAVPAPGGVQLTDDPMWSWVGDNVAKGASALPALTLHTRPDVAQARFDVDPETLRSELLVAARPWIGDALVLDAVLHRWRHAIPDDPFPEPCFAAAGGTIILAGDAFGEPRVEGAFLSGRAAAQHLGA